MMPETSVVFNMSTALNGEAIGVWKIDMTSGEPTKVMELANKDGLLDGYRVDYFAVKGDVTKDAHPHVPGQQREICDSLRY